MSKKNQALPSYLRPDSPYQAGYPYPQPVPPLFDRPAPDVLPSSYTIHVSVLSDSRATVAQANLTDGNRGHQLLTATGSSKRANADEYDQETGTLLAVSRALEALSRKLAKQAASRVKTADANRAHKAARSGKPVRGFDLGAALIEQREGLEIVAHLLPGLTPEDVPQEVKDTLRRLFPGLKFAEFDDSEMMAAFADLLSAPPQGKHTKDSNEPDGDR